MRAGSLVRLGAVLIGAAGACAFGEATPAAQVLVMPFSSVGASGGEVPAWVGTAIQENLAADLGRFHLQPVAGSTPADRGSARYLINGTYQSTDGTVRFDGQIIDATTNSVVGGLSATGPVRDLFTLEDSLSMQAVHQLNRLLHPEADAKPAAPADPAVAAAVPAAPAAPAIPAPGTGELPTTTNLPYDGSSLQAFVNSDNPPANDYWDQLAASRDRQSYGSYPVNNYGYGYGYGGWGYGYPFGSGWCGYPGYGGYPPGYIGIPYFGGYYGGAYGGYGYGGSGGYGGYGGGYGGGYSGGSWGRGSSGGHGHSGGGHS